MTVRSFAKQVWRLLLGDSQAWRYLPYQIKTKRHGLDLTWVSVRDSGLSEQRSHWHSNSGGPDLDDLLRGLPISSSDTVIDIGCGKGGAMLTLARYPFSRINGVEISSNLAQIARQNLRRMGISNSTVFTGDAAAFTDLDCYTYIYMYNPFPEIVVQSVAANIAASLRRRSRKLTLIYKNPVFASVLVDAGFRKVCETLQRHPDYPPFHVYIADSKHCEPLVQC